MINPAEIELLQKALARLAEGYPDLPEFTPGFDADATAAAKTAYFGDKYERARGRSRK